MNSDIDAGMQEAKLLFPEIALVKEARSGAVWKWLDAGWADFRATWRVSALYAATFVLGGFFVSFGFYFMDLPYLVLPGICGFLLLGPALGVGFYEISRRRESGEEIPLSTPYLGFRRNSLAIMGFGICLVFLFQVWIRLSFTLGAIAFPGVSPEIAAIIERAFTTFQGVHFLGMITVLGFIFAVIIFCTGAFSMPLMIDRRTMLVPAMMTSFFAVKRSPTAMALWSFMIVMIMGAGLFTFFFGLILAFPLIGHATWHAYKDVIRED